jgi:tRNA threonylcarbamoyladenosine biosynthesis protein TsaB
VRVLGIDTSTDLGSVAVLVDGELCAEVHARVRARHGETLLPVVARALETAGVERSEIDLLAVGIGPGSFTGTRIGVATAKGLAVALDRPLVGVESLLALALAAPGLVVVPVVDAHKGEVYAAAYTRVQGVLETRLAPLHAPPGRACAAVRAVLGDVHEDLVVCGSGARRYREVVVAAFGERAVLPPLWDAPRAALVAHEGERRFHATGRDERANLEPLYVRPSDAVLPSNPAEPSSPAAALPYSAEAPPDPDAAPTPDAIDS